MAKQRVNQQSARTIEDLPRPQEELTPEQAEAVEGGIQIATQFPGGSLSVEPPPPAPAGVLSRAEPDKPEPKPPKVQFGFPIR
jgi:hypothetical protein